MDQNKYRDGVEQLTDHQTKLLPCTRNNDYLRTADIPHKLELTLPSRMNGPMPFRDTPISPINANIWSRRKNAPDSTKMSRIL